MPSRFPGHHPRSLTGGQGTTRQYQQQKETTDDDSADTGLQKRCQLKGAQVEIPEKAHHGGNEAQAQATNSRTAREQQQKTIHF